MSRSDRQPERAVLRFWMIVASLVAALIVAWAIVTFAPAQWIDYGLIAFAVVSQLIFEIVGWRQRPRGRLLRIAFKAAFVAVFAWWLYPFDAPFAQ